MKTINSYFTGKDFSRDALTNLFTRDVVVDYIKYLLSKKIPFSFAIVDIDNFKYINDSFGHKAGDEVLSRVAAKILSLLPDNAIVGRYGGDEFLIVLENHVKYDEVWRICHNYQSGVSEMEILPSTGKNVTLTTGLARFPENGTDYDLLFEKADKALYRGKTKGRNCFIIYLPEKHDSIDLKKESEKNLNSTYLHTLIFNMLSNENLGAGIYNLFDFIDSYYMFDSICIQTSVNGCESLIFNKSYPLSKLRKLYVIDTPLLRKNMNRSTGLFYFNAPNKLKLSNRFELLDFFEKQKTLATCYCEITYKGKYYGLLRVDSSYPRIWQNSDMDILVTIARTIALILYYQNKNIEDIFSETIN